MKARLLTATCLAVLAVSAAPAAHATTYSNTSSSVSSYGSWGTSQGHPAAGEVFTAPGGTLDSWSFLLDSLGQTGNLDFVIAEWNPTTFTPGSVLYTSAPTAISGPSGTLESYSFNDLKLDLTAGSEYFAYMTDVGVSSPINDFNTGITSTKTAISVDDMWSTGSSFGGNGWDFAYSATFSPAASVPEPATLSVLGIGIAGLIASRRRKGARKALAD